MEYFSFKDEVLNRFYISLCRSLQQELKLFSEIINADFESSRYVALFEKVFVNDLGQEYVDSVRDGIITKSSSSSSINGFTSLFGQDESKDILQVIALEATYRFGALLKNQLAYCSYFSNIDPLEKSDLVAKFAAIRIACFAFNSGTNARNTESMVRGIAEGYKGFLNPSLSSKLDSLALTEYPYPYRYTSLSSLLSSSGVMVPIEGTDTYGHFFRRVKNSCIGFQIQPRMVQTSWYGPCTPRKKHTEYLRQSSMRYVNKIHVEKYLQYLDNPMNDTFRISFNDWLKQAYPNEFKADVVLAIVRDCVFEDVEFKVGDFSNVDFGSCAFIGVSFGVCKDAMFTYCSFHNCNVDAGDLDGSILLFSNMKDCFGFELCSVHMKYCNMSVSAKSLADSDHCPALKKLRASSIEGTVVDVLLGRSTSTSSLPSFAKPLNGIVRDVSFSAVELPVWNLIDCSGFTYKRPIGHGWSSQVWKEQLNGVAVAVKSVIDNDTPSVDERLKMFLKEVKVLQYCSTIPGVIKLLGVNDQIRPSKLILEYAKCSLDKHLHDLPYKAEPRFSLTEKISLLIECCECFNALHSIDMIHRDIKPANILLMPDNHIRVSDFGTGMIPTLVSASLGINPKGTIEYMAPEILTCTESYQEMYCEATDVYAFGITMNEFLCEQRPYKIGSNITALMCKNELTRPILYSGSYVLREVICKCWSVGPQDRPSFDKVLEMLKEHLATLEPQIEN